MTGSVLLQRLRNRVRFPGLPIHASVNHDVRGTVEYGTGCTISEGCNLIVPEGARLVLGSSCFVGRHVELGPRGSIEIGDRTSIQDRSILLGDVNLGRYCILSLNVLMTSGTHYYARWPELLIRDQDGMVTDDPALSAKHSRLITIGEDCWLGVNSVVMPGRSLGRGCVVGANAVVTDDLPPFSVAVGAPARVIKQRLAFVPPRRIDWREQTHLPYFYAGFQLARDERQRNQSSGGHLAGARFALWLAHDGELRVRARASNASNATLECRGTKENVGSDWTECRFPTGGDQGPTHFQVGGGGLVVSQAWLA